MQKPEKHSPASAFFLFGSFKIPANNVLLHLHKGLSKSIISYFSYLFWIYSSIPAAAVFPAPMARITVAAPVTASPPA